MTVPYLPDDIMRMIMRHRAELLWIDSVDSVGIAIHKPCMSGYIRTAFLKCPIEPRLRLNDAIRFWGAYE